MRVRTIMLLKKLLSSPYPISTKSLSNMFNVSIRTIHNSIMEANDYLAGLGLETIKNVRGKGVCIRVSTKERSHMIENIFKDGYFFLEKEERELDLLLSFGFSSSPVFLNKKENEFSVSKSTIDEDMRRLRKQMGKYNIEIVSNGKKGCAFEGSERSIRTMLFDVIKKEIEIVNFQSDFFGQLSINRKILNNYISDSDINKVFDIFDSHFDTMGDELYKKQIVLFTLIWIYRLKKKETIGLINWGIMDDTDEEVDTKDYIASIIDAFNLEVSIIEKEYLTFIITSLNTDSPDTSVNWVNSQIITINLMQFVEETTGIPFHKKEEALYESLFEHIHLMIARLKSGVQVFNPILESIKKNYSEIYTAVQQYKPNIEAVIDAKISESEISFLAIHFSTIYTYLREESSLSYKCLVVCNHGIATSNLLAANLKKNFPEVDIVAVIGSRDVSVIEKLDVDLVFSTSSIDISEKPLIVVDPIITEDSLIIIKEFLDDNIQFGRLKINTDSYTNLFNEIVSLIDKRQSFFNEDDYKKLQTLFKSNGLKINLEEIQPMLKDKLNDSHIIMNATTDSWENAIEIVSKPLLDEGIITQDYVNAMIDSVKEHGPYIVIGKNLALAHARPEDGVNELGISVLKLREPVEFGNEEMDPVSLVFCLAATDSYSHLNIMKELVSLINDEDRLDKLLSVDSTEEFKHILFESELKK